MSFVFAVKVLAVALLIFAAWDAWGAQVKLLLTNPHADVDALAREKAKEAIRQQTRDT